MVKYPEEVWKAFKDELAKKNYNSRPKAYGILKRYRDNLEFKDTITGIGVGVTMRRLRIGRLKEGNVKGKMYHAFQSVK